MKTLTFLAIWGPGGGGGGVSLKNQIGPILVHIYPLDLLYINLHVKHGSNLIRIF